MLYKRKTNRGIESLAVSPDESKLYTILQNPLVNPDSTTYKAARNVRLLVIDRVSERVIGEYVYQLTPFADWPHETLTAQDTQRISEMMALGDDRLLVLERTEKTTRLYEIVLKGATDVLGTGWDDPEATPSLEASNDLAAVGIVPPPKTLRWDSADWPDAPTKLEGLAVLGDGSLAMINDDDFGIVGKTTRIVVLSGSGIGADVY